MLQNWHLCGLLLSLSLSDIPSPQGRAVPFPCSLPGCGLLGCGTLHSNLSISKGSVCPRRLAWSGLCLQIQVLKSHQKKVTVCDLALPKTCLTSDSFLVFVSCVVNIERIFLIFVHFVGGLRSLKVSFLKEILLTNSTSHLMTQLSCRQSFLLRHFCQGTASAEASLDRSGASKKQGC